ncbi:hypothetical protein ABZZ74_08845 [Streptomyces sp. NPDC006476]|uniref:hypothetical protein n=1 Tax=Streptomyces sp. NPDC006476 TaxID=3157175 RepID=UPI0033A8B468
MPFAGCGVARLAAVVMGVLGMSWGPGVLGRQHRQQNPGIVSVPVGVLLGRLGSLLSGRQETQAYDEFEVRTLVGFDQS